MPASWHERAPFASLRADKHVHNVTRACTWIRGLGQFVGRLVGMAQATFIDSGWPTPEVFEIPPIDGARGPVLVWRFDHPFRSISSAIVGGGIGSCHWVLNMTVDPLYSRFDPDVHIAEVATLLGLSGHGLGLLTAVDVRMHTFEQSDGAVACSTVGVRRPVWAFDSAEALPQREMRLVPDTAGMPKPGTINLVCLVEQRLSDAALVNAVATITEAKTQALSEDRKSTRLNSSHVVTSRMPSSA